MGYERSPGDPGSWSILPAQTSHLTGINDVYNHYVVNTHITFDLEPVSIERRTEWLTHYGESGRYRALVAVKSETVLGFATSSPWRPRPAYETSIETTVYVRPVAAGTGVGSALYASLFALLEDEDVHRAYAGIAMPNDASVALHERFDFRRAGYFSEQGRKFGRFWDVAWYEKEL